MLKHVLCIPFPTKSHIFPMLKFAKILHLKYGFHVTFLSNQYNHQTLFQSNTQNNTFSSSKDNSKATFKFESIQDDSNDTQSSVDSVFGSTLGPSLKEALLRLCSSKSDDNYYDITSLSCDGDAPPPVSCIVFDVAMSLITVDVAGEMGVPAVAFDVINACGVLGYLQQPQLLDKGIVPLKDSSCLTSGYLEMSIDWIPSLKGIHLKDLSSSFRTTDPKNRCLNFVNSFLNKALESKVLILNTFDALEKDVLEDLSSFSPNIYAIGPFDLLLSDVEKNNDATHGSSTKTNEVCDYIQWLDSQEPNSVLYISFGTVVKLTEEQFDELAWGLANSQLKFFWIVRPDQVNGRHDTPPIGYEDEVKHNGIFATWCDQKVVLAHPSIGGFVTQCGWNSVTESICSGVPMICCPIFLEQFTTSWYCCNCLGIGVDISEAKKRDEVTKVLKEFMEGEKRNDLRKNAMKWKDLAIEATMNPHGSSCVKLERLVYDVLISNN